MSTTDDVIKEIDKITDNLKSIVTDGDWDVERYKQVKNEADKLIPLKTELEREASNG